MKLISAATLAFTLALTAGSAGLTGCQSSAPDQTLKATQNLDKLATDLQVASDRIGTTLGSLAKLEASADSALRPEYDNYVKEVGALNSSAKTVKKDFDAVGASTEAKFKSWEEMIATLSNPDFQKRNRERLDESKKNYEEVATAVKATNEKFDALLSDLNDIKESLGFDLSKTGVTSWSEAIDRSNKSGTELRETFTKTIDGIKEIKESMSAGSPPPAPAGTEGAAEGGAGGSEG